LSVRSDYHVEVLPSVIPQLVANDGTRALRQAIADPDRFACEPKVDGVRGLVVYQPGRVLAMRNRRGEKRDWLRGDKFEAGLRRLDDRLPNLWEGTVLDGELTAGNDVGASRVEAVPTIAPVRRVRRAGAPRS
jgi:ATP-dependent DNA ligase